jgi:hypothetical protein
VRNSVETPSRYAVIKERRMKETEVEKERGEE